MAEAVYAEIPKTVMVRTVTLKMSIGEAKANLNGLQEVVTPNQRQIDIMATLTEALASAPDEP